MDVRQRKLDVENDDAESGGKSEMLRQNLYVRFCINIVVRILIKLKVS